MIKKILIAMLLIIGIAQVIPVDRTNPPVETEIPVDAEIRQLLQRSCYDCHSNETRWPWYAQVAPVSWLVADDVKHARDHLNFSTWNAYDSEKQAEIDDLGVKLIIFGASMLAKGSDKTNRVACFLECTDSLH